MNDINPVLLLPNAKLHPTHQTSPNSWCYARKSSSYVKGISKILINNVRLKQISFTLSNFDVEGKYSILTAPFHDRNIVPSLIIAACFFRYSVALHQILDYYHWQKRGQLHSYSFIIFNTEKMTARALFHLTIACLWQYPEWIRLSITIDDNITLLILVASPYFITGK
jgi:hypothetical protein